VFEDITIKVISDNTDDFRLKNLLGDVYGFTNDDYDLEYDKEGKATVTVYSGMDHNARIAVNVKENGQKAYLSLYPSINYGAQIDNNTIEEYLIDEKSLHPDLLNWDKIKEGFQHYVDGCIVENMLISEGLQPVNGTDAKFDIHFEMAERKPKELEDGSVDFRDINTIVTVQEDDLLLTYHKETDGTDGMKVTGEPIPAKKGKKINIRKGNNVSYDDETSTYSATQAGHITFISNKLNVNPVYAVRGDVDYSEGNVEFDGTVTVSGDVLSGFTVKARNISVWGVVKDATLEAEEDIVVKTGIKSTGKAMIRAGNAVTSGFIEGAEIHAGIEVNIKNYCFNAKIFCEGEINAHTGDGIINGGEYYAFSSVRAKQIGADNGTPFTIHLGMKHDLNDRLEKLMTRKEELEKIIVETDKKIKDLARKNPDIHKNPKLKSIINSRALMVKRYEGTDDRVEEIIKESMHPMPFVRVDDSIKPGVTLIFYNTEHTIRQETPATKFLFNQSNGKIIRVKPTEELGSKKGKRD